MRRRRRRWRRLIIVTIAIEFLLADTVFIRRLRRRNSLSFRICLARLTFVRRWIPRVPIGMRQKWRYNEVEEKFQIQMQGKTWKMKKFILAWRDGMWQRSRKHIRHYSRFSFMISSEIVKNSSTIHFITISLFKLEETLLFATSSRRRTKFDGRKFHESEQHVLLSGWKQCKCCMDFNINHLITKHNNIRGKRQVVGGVHNENNEMEIRKMPSN